MLYRVAVETGLKAGELRSLICSCFDLEVDPPTVTVAAAYSKRRREDTLPLRQELADDLRLFMSRLAPSTPVFNVPKPDQIIDLPKPTLPKRASRIATKRAEWSTSTP